MSTPGQHWTQAVASSVTIIVVAAALNAVLVDLAAYLVTRFAGLLFEPPPANTMHLSRATAGVISVGIALLLTVGIWKSTPRGALADARASLFRNGLRVLVLSYTAALTLVAILVFSREAGSFVALSWVVAVLWWGLVLLGLVYVRRLLLRLNEERLARQTGLLWGAYAVWIPGSFGSSHLIRAGWRRANAMRGEEKRAATDDLLRWILIESGTHIVLRIVFVVLVAGILWKLQRALLRQLRDGTSSIPPASEAAPHNPTAVR